MEDQEPTDRDGALLKVHVGYYGLPDARETGRILVRLSNAFTQQMRFDRALPGARLVVDAIHIESFTGFLRDLFEVGGAIIKVADHRAFLQDFVSAVANAIMMIGQSGGVPP